MREPECMKFQPSEWVPNHPRLPVLLYRQALSAAESDAAAFERRFAAAGWQGLWRNGVFSYQHYHIGAHEVLGIAGGNAKLLIGGPDGVVLKVGAGDCLVLPAGTGHRNLGSSDAFLVVGGYPPGQTADIQTRAASTSALQTIANLPLPATDPLHGADGPLTRLWKEA
ncbi:cupin [Sinorhizobium fredii]|uniref:Cupin 2 domain-containing protein n=1 Tax=Rhizobium fredii TaxID=380 RepID=A0A2L0HEC3_RHIFR|nr:cupin [Sinorhizobium fredii]AUX79532.1 cupin 2 domain-containing protein [Sinorhizobium fredii]